ncbi:Xaa-Pro peptidase family protein [Treponema sp.]|uniref:M24 family metallopeptidase n=1 Tax=Treponema sp. TaxID=166 RepID=UPI00298D99C8|nr:Xaa-Pro peptidase family protein [Treponema sp.]MCQ2240371.1 Xaa-Pro peptidase family protein [Treponema sp.]
MNFDVLYRTRRTKVSAYMKEHGIKAAVFEDSEDRREPALRYLTGHPTDALLLITDDGNSILIPWDENLAKERAHADQVISSTKYERNYAKALVELLSSYSHEKGSVIAFCEETQYCQYAKYREELKDWDIQLKEDSVHNFVRSMRAVKDAYEIECTKKACAITDEMTIIIMDSVKSGKFTTEMDVALFVERYLREKGAERTSFDTLAAGPGRSFAIHAFPGYTGGLWASKGLSILDYGVCYEGYASDCTITVANKPSSEQQKLLDLVQTAADECRKLYMPGMKISDAVAKADQIFAEAGRNMPHGLGHGTGLEIHEAPFVSKRAPKDKTFVPGNIITLEPGLYDPELGGVRLENDVLITETGNELLLNSKIFII